MQVTTAVYLDPRNILGEKKATILLAESSFDADG